MSEVIGDTTYKWRHLLEALLAPLLALLAAVVLFSIFLLFLGQSPLDFVDLVWRGAFGSWFSLQNTLQRAAPLLLTALCVAVPGQLGLVVIGGEAAVVLGGLAATVAALPLIHTNPYLVWAVMAVAGSAMGALWIGLTGFLRARLGVNEVIASLVLAYIGIALFNHLVEGVFRDPASLNKPSTYEIGDDNMLGTVPWLDVHPGIPIGVIACVLCWVLIYRTSIGFSGRVTGGNIRAAQLQGLPVSRLIILACCLGGACAGLAGTIEVAAELGRANASLAAGYGYTGILIAFLARFNPLAIIPMAVLLGGLGAAGGLLQRRMGLPDATVQVLQGMIFVAILASDTIYGRVEMVPATGGRLMADLSAIGTVAGAMMAGSLRVSTPFLFVSLGECLTEKSGRINLGNEGVLVLGAMVGYATSYETGDPWLGVLAAAVAGMILGGLHGAVCSLARVNDVAMGIAIMLAGTGIAFFFGKPYVQPSAPLLPGIPLAWWSDSAQLRNALLVSPLFFIGIGAAVAMHWFFRTTRMGLRIRIVGDSQDAALALGLPIDRTRFLATACGSGLAGIGGAFLSLSYPGSWNEGLSSGQGLMAVALVVFARWNPINCVYASLLFGAAGALGPSLQTVGVTWGYYLFYAAPYVVTLVVLIISARAGGSLRGMPGQLSIGR